MVPESLTVVGEPTLDRFGNVITEGDVRVISGCVVGLRGQATVDGGGVWDGDATTLEVLAPGGAVVREGELVEFRGQEYRVVHVPFDWSPGRRPVNPRHKPRTVFVVERREA